MQASADSFAPTPVGHNFVLRVPLARATANKCARSDCQLDIRAHARSEVTDEQLLMVLQSQDDGTPSEVLAGELYVGSYKAALAVCKGSASMAVLNCAGQSIHELLPLTRAPFDKLRNENPPRLCDLEWKDDTSFSIPLADIVAALAWTREKLARGYPILINCAQGKSRSGTMAVAFLMAKLKLPVDEALARVKRCRPIVQPNPSFMRALVDFETDIHKQPAPISASELQLHAAFQRYDVDHSGGLNLAELRKALIDCGDSANVAKQLIEEFDADGSGEISLDAFAQAWRARNLRPSVPGHSAPAAQDA